MIYSFIYKTNTERNWEKFEKLPRVWLVFWIKCMRQIWKPPRCSAVFDLCYSGGKKDGQRSVSVKLQLENFLWDANYWFPCVCASNDAAQHAASTLSERVHEILLDEIITEPWQISYPPCLRMIIISLEISEMRYFFFF